MDVLERAADWCDLRSVDYSIVRDGDHWLIMMHLSDGNGKFSAYLDLPVESIPGSLEKKLEASCFNARRARMKIIRYSKA
jgi:hypothetical protein